MYFSGVDMFHITMTILWKLIHATLFGLLLCCDEGWVLYTTTGYCYKVYKYSPKDWWNSRIFCVKENATLASFADYSEQMFISKTVLSGLVNANIGAWVGASQGTSESTWRWTNNYIMDIDKYLWKKGNPDDNSVLNEYYSGGEDCVLISLERGFYGTLNDYTCSRKLPFVCKMKDKSVTTTTASIPPVTSSTTYVTTTAASTTFVTASTTSVTTTTGSTMLSKIVLPVLTSVLLVIAGISICVIICTKKRRSAAVNSYETIHPAVTYNSAHMYQDLEREHVYQDLERGHVNQNIERAHVYQDLERIHVNQDRERTNVNQDVEKAHEYEDIE